MSRQEVQLHFLQKERKNEPDDSSDYNLIPPYICGISPDRLQFLFINLPL